LSQRAIELLLKGAFTATLLETGAGKVFTGSRAVTIWPSWLTVVFGVIELLAVPILWMPHRWAMAGIGLGVVLAVGGIAFSLWAPSGAECGCLGTLRKLSRREHLMLSATIGAVSTALLALRPIAKASTRSRPRV
jgi:hypothetical protein